MGVACYGLCLRGSCCVVVDDRVLRGLFGVYGECCWFVGGGWVGVL